MDENFEKERTMTSQKVAVITGASQGIGATLVTAYRKLGYAVVANSRTIEPSGDPFVLTVPGDIAIPGVGARIIEAGLEAFGRIDTVVNNAGVFVAKPFTEYTDADYDLVAGVNLRGFFELTRRAVDAMLEQGGGHIELGHQVARHRVRRPRHPGQRRRSRCYPYADARRGDARVPGRLAPGRPTR